MSKQPKYSSDFQHSKGNPKSVKDIHSNKRPKNNDVQSTISGKPKWVFRHIALDGAFSFRRFFSAAGKWEKILKQLQDYETMIGRGNGGIEGDRCHFLNTNSFSSKGRKAWEEFSHVNPDNDTAQDHTFSLRFDSEERIIGVLEGDVFQIIWWDPKHEFCECKKKHT